jgi:methylisocitrate lyase
MSSGKEFKQALSSHHSDNRVLPILGTINAYTAMLAKKSKADVIYLSGAGVANASYGFPDLSITNLNDVMIDVNRILNAVDLPLLVDIDTGFGQLFSIQRTIKTMERAGVAAIHIEDQVVAKRCGHRPNKLLVSIEEMQDRIKACVDSRIDNDFVIMARTDAYGVEGIEAAIDRSNAYVEMGADMIFAEAMTSLDEYALFCKKVNVPVLANITEFGKTPLFSQTALFKHGVSMALYPLSAFRAMSKAALNVYTAIIEAGSQESIIELMQSREELYDVLNYVYYEELVDNLNQQSKELTQE